MRRELFIVAVAVVAGGVLSSCGEKTKTVIQPESTGKVTFNLIETVGGVEAHIDELNLQYTNPFGTEFSLKTLVYVISDVKLHRADGQVYGMDGIHFRDASDPSTAWFELAGVPKGTYDAISFTFGLDETKNIRGLYSDDQNFENIMAWPTNLGANLGYHYMKIEGNFRDTPTTTKGFLTHFGARQCDGTCGPMGDVTDPVPYHHYFRVNLPIANAAIHGNSITVQIWMNINDWYLDTKPNDGFDSNLSWLDLGDMQMIMANLEAQDKLMVNGPACFQAFLVPPPNAVGSW